MNRRAWLQRSAMAAAVLPVSNWYLPDIAPMPGPSRSGGGIRLSHNENPYGPSDAVRKAVVQSLDLSNRYPADSIEMLKEKIAQREGLTAKHVLITAGSTELLGLTGLVYGLHKGELASFHPTFDFMLLYAEKLGCTWARTPVDGMMQQNMNVLASVLNANTKLIFICNPNNPTGIEIPNEQLRSFCKTHAPQYPTYIDEAYIELSAHGRKSSMVDLVDSHPNLIIGRTFSKVYGLAGLRIGYVLAHPDTIKKLADMHTGRSMTMAVTSCVAAITALDDTVFENFSREKIVEGRNMVNAAFDSWGVRYLPSATNFIFFENKKFASDPVKALAADEIYLRSYMHTPGWSRVSIGTMEEMKVFIETARKYLLV
jgi:histidinol-phosphate aminotransferase